MKQTGTEQLTTYHLGTCTSVSLPTIGKVRVPVPRCNTGSWAVPGAGIVLCSLICPQERPLRQGRVQESYHFMPFSLRAARTGTQ